jgi:hypothetical protein
MGQAAVQAAQATLSQMQSVDSGYGYGYGNVGITPMIGDDNSTFTLDNAATVKNWADVSQDQFNQIFPNRNGFYTYDGLLNAMNSYPGFATTGSDTTQRQEAAAFLANVSHETGGLVYIDEQNTANYPTSCDWSQPYGCPAGQAAYYGRGPLQLSWNFNYKAAGDALGIDLLDKSVAGRAGPGGRVADRALVLVHRDRRRWHHRARRDGQQRWLRCDDPGHQRRSGVQRQQPRRDAGPDQPLHAVRRHLGRRPGRQPVLLTVPTSPRRRLEAVAGTEPAYWEMVGARQFGVAGNPELSGVCGRLDLRAAQADHVPRQPQRLDLESTVHNGRTVDPRGRAGK